MAKMDFADVIKDSEMKRLSWIILMGPKCNHMYPYNREAKGHLIHTEEEKAM